MSDIPELKPPPLKPGGALLLVFVHVAAFMTVTILMAALSRGDADAEQTVIGAWNLPIAQAVGLLTALYVGLARYAPGEALPDVLRARRPRVAELVSAVVALGIGVGAAVPAYAVLFRIIAAREGSLDELRAQVQPMPTAGLAIAVLAQLLLVPAASELFFRGFAQGRLEKTMGRVGAMLVVAILASLAQLNPYMMPGGLLVALPLGVLALITGSVWVPLAAHVGLQGADLVLGDGVLLATPVGPSVRAITIGVAGAVVGLGLVAVVSRSARRA